jgi:putative transposase
LTCKTHTIVDGLGRPLVIAVTPGQAGDSIQLIRLLGELSVDRLVLEHHGQPRPRCARTRPTPAADTARCFAAEASKR